MENWDIQLHKGIIELYILTLLQEKERYAYEIMNQVVNFSQIPIKAGTIYPLLKRLQRDALLTSRWQESSGGPPRKYYSLTKEGERCFKERMEKWEKMKTVLSTMKARIK